MFQTAMALLPVLAFALGLAQYELFIRRDLESCIYVVLFFGAIGAYVAVTVHSKTIHIIYASLLIFELMVLAGYGISQVHSAENPKRSGSRR
jgi:uncharacterized membrane protein YoaK (UPF0700 family)